MSVHSVGFRLGMQRVLGPILYPDVKVSVDAFSSVIIFTSSVLSSAIPTSFHLQLLFFLLSIQGTVIRSFLLPLGRFYHCWCLLCGPVGFLFLSEVVIRFFFHQRVFPTSLKFTHWFWGLDSAFSLVHFFISCVFIWVVCGVFSF